MRSDDHLRQSAIDAIITASKIDAAPVRWTQSKISSTMHSVKLNTYANGSLCHYSPAIEYKEIPRIAIRKAPAVLTHV